jgi:hypothetical protein
LGGKFFCGRIQVNLVLPYFCWVTSWALIFVG